MSEIESGDAEPTLQPLDTGASIQRLLDRTTKLLALVGGAIMLLLTVMTVISVVRRFLFDAPVTGDYEITELACGIAAFLFFPYTQITGQNLVADFFTSGIPDRYRRRVEAIHTVIYALVAGFFAWRLFEGMLDKLASSSRTMLVGIPLWWGYAVAVPACVVLCGVCLWGASRLVIGSRG